MSLDLLEIVGSIILVYWLFGDAIKEFFDYLFSAHSNRREKELESKIKSIERQLDRLADIASPNKSNRKSGKPKKRPPPPPPGRSIPKDHPGHKLPSEYTDAVLTVNGEVIKPGDPRFKKYSGELDREMAKLDIEMAKLDEEISSVFESPHIPTKPTKVKSPDLFDATEEELNKGYKPEPIKPKEPDVIDLLSLGKKDSS